MTSEVEAKLAEMGLALPDAPAPAAKTDTSELYLTVLGHQAPVECLLWHQDCFTGSTRSANANPGLLCRRVLLESAPTGYKVTADLPMEDE